MRALNGKPTVFFTLFQLFHNEFPLLNPTFPSLFAPSVATRSVPSNAELLLCDGIDGLSPGPIVSCVCSKRAIPMQMGAIGNGVVEAAV